MGVDRSGSRDPGGWRYYGQERPPFALRPGPGQESVWDYPRPPRLEVDSRRVVVRAGDLVIADTERATRVLETASPPTFYVPPEDVDRERLLPAPGSSFCEWKGTAVYWSVRAGDAVLHRVAWSYPEPRAGFERLAGHVSFYPGHIECRVGSRRVEPQPGSFYGGWVTPELVGPFKGEPGTGGW